MAKTVFRPFEIVSLQSTMVLKHEGQEGRQAVQAAEEVPDDARNTRAHRRRPAARGRGLQGPVGQGEGSARSPPPRPRPSASSRRPRAPPSRKSGARPTRPRSCRQEAEEEATRIVGEAEKRVAELEASAESRLEAAEREAAKKGREEGREEGYKEGVAEAERLVGRLHVILDRAMDKRAEILPGDRGPGRRARPPRRQEGRQGHLREPEERRDPEHHPGPPQAQDQERRHRAGSTSPTSSSRPST